MTGVCRVAAVPPVFEMVMFCAALVAPTLVDGKLNVSGVNTIVAAAMPVPVRVAVAWPPATLP
jgi:hypothetical protein